MASHNRTHASDRGKAVVDIPGIPTIGTATAGPESATVEFTANVKGGAATSWTALSSPGSITGTGSSSPITVTGLTAGTAYTFTVRGANATGTGEYSAASNSVVPEVATSYESIATVTVGAGGSSTITFSSIPSTYKHLQIRGIGRANTGQSATSLADLFMRINSDTGSNYARHRLLGDGSTASAGATISQTQIPWTALFPRSTSTANLFGGFVIDILDYQNTNKYKTLRCLGGADINGTGGTIGFQSALWMSTSAITGLTFTFETDSNPNPSAQYSSFALYGIRG